MRFRTGTSWSGRCEVTLTLRSTDMSNYAGVDWAADKHDVRVGDETGEELLAATFAHRRAGAAGAVPHATAAEGGAGRDRAAGRAAGRAAAGRGAAGAAD